MKRVYTWMAQEAMRTVTVAGMQKEKGSRKWTQVTANTAEEANAAQVAGIDMIACNSVSIEEVRKGTDTLFVTASLIFPNFATYDDILRESFRCLQHGADAIMTARSMEVVEKLAKEDIPVMGHLGLVPRKSTWTDGLRAVGKDANEAIELFQKFKELENAGAVLVEAEVIPGKVMEIISNNCGLITVSLGSGPWADVNYLFMEDICGEKESAPRHAKAYTNLHKLYEEIKAKRIKALQAFKEDAMAGTFPSDKETVDVDEIELRKFQDFIESK